MRSLKPFLDPGIVKRDGFVCNMDFGLDSVAVAGTITKNDPQ